MAVSTCEGAMAPLEQADAGGNGEAAQVERDHQRLAIDAVEIHVAGVGRAVPARAVDAGAGNAVEHGVLQAVAQRGEPLGFGGQASAPASFGRGAEGRDAGNVLRAGAAVALVMAAEGDGRERASPCARRARPRPWARRACGRSCCRGPRPARPRPPESCPAPARHPRAAARRPRARCAQSRRWAGWCPVSLLACMMETSTVSGPQRAAHVVGIHHAVRRPRGRRVTATPSRSSCAHGPSTAGCSMALVMTCRAGAGGRAHHAQHRHVVGLGAAAGEDHFGGARVDQRGQLPPRRFQPLLGGLPEMVDAGSVTIHLTETRHHASPELRERRGWWRCGRNRNAALYLILTMPDADPYADHRFRPFGPLRGRHERRDSGHLPAGADRGHQPRGDAASRSPRAPT